jgi:hypothetical protein
VILAEVTLMQGVPKIRPTLDEGPESNFLGTNLDWFEANWILELDKSTLVPSLILGALNLELSF